MKDEPEYVVEWPEPAPVHTRPIVIGKALGAAWCARGGTGFGPRGSENELPDCGKKIFITVSDEMRAGDVEAAVIELRADVLFSEEERYLYLRRGEVENVFFLAHGFSSGVGGFSHEIRLSNFRVGEGALDWSAEIVSEQHDSDMGLCALTGSERRDFVACTFEKGAFQCLQLPLVDIVFEESANRDSSGDCGTPKVVRSGFAASLRVAKGDIFVEPLPPSKEAPITAPKPLPHRGKVDVAALTAKYPAKRIIL